MNKERIIQLLESTCLDDIILAVTLAYKLPFHEFKQIFDGREYKHVTNRRHCYFKREEERWLFHTITVKPNYDELGTSWLDITPQIEEL